MLDIGKLIKNRRLCQALLGISPTEFQRLSEQFEKCLYVERKKRMNRQRAVGGGRRGKLPSAADKLAFVLIYLKVYPTYDVMGFLTHRAASKCCESIKQFLPILEQVLGHACVLPKRQIRSAAEFYEAFPSVRDVFIDGTERRIQRPKREHSARKHYSGKKKCHTRKTIVMVDAHKRIGVMSPTKSGRRHDKRLADKSTLFDHIPDDVGVCADTGFQGAGDKHANLLLPYKATKKKSLTTEQKKANQLIGAFRVIVEHAIGGYKRFKAASDIYRNKRPNLDDQFHSIAAGLWNFHLQYGTANS